MNTPEATASKASEAPKLTLLAFPIPNLPPMKIVPASPDRPWMSASQIPVANHCLPMRVANQTGWAILNNEEVQVIWNGGRNLSDVRISTPNSASAPNALSHFGFGIITWRLPFLFRTPKGFNLRVRGPVNWYKDGIAPLEGIVETDWSIANISMSWKITRVSAPIRFEAGEALCMIYPEERSLIEQFVPELHSLDEDPDLRRQHRAWNESRFLFNRSVANATNTEKWQKHYFLGQRPTEDVVFPEHQVRVAIRPFQDFQKSTAETVVASGTSRPFSAAENVPTIVEHATVPKSRVLQRIVRQPVDALKPGAKSDGSAEDLQIEGDFYEHANILRAQFEKQALSASALEPNQNPFVYVYSAEAYQCLAANVDRVFTADLLLSLTERLRAWAQRHLRLSHASSPRLRIYVNGCWRALLRDDIGAKWHYILALTRNPKRKLGRIRVTREAAPDQQGGTLLTVSRLLNIELEFNHILVHRVDRLYGIDPVKGSMNPEDGLIFLDGYLW